MCVNGVGNPRTRRRPDRQVRVLAKSASDLVKAFSVMAFLAIGLELPASAASRVALVIGNSAYAHVPVIPNPLNDAADIGSALGRLGFSVTRLENADYSALRRGLQEFQRAASAAEIAVVFYAGHGIEVDKQNFLVPVDARLASDRDVEFEAVSLDLVIRTVEHAGKLRLVILDACRDNPFAARMERGGATRSIGRGLSRVEPSGEMLVAYAAKEGTVALDGTGRNSPYTAALLRHLEEPGLEVGLMFRKVRDAVLETTGREQEPFTYGSLSSRGAYLTEPPAAGLPAAQTAPSGAGSAAADPAVLARLRAEEELLFWDSIRDSNDPEDFRAYRGRYPGGRFEVLALNRLRRLEAAGREGVEGATASAPLESPSSGLGPEALELSLGLDRLEWRLVQVGLASLGFDPGPADGLIGRGTRGAIGRLQASRGLEATGYLDAEFTKELLAAADDALAADDAAFARAKAAGTPEAYAAYLRAHPSGYNAAEARRLQAEAEESERLRPGSVFRDCAECPEMVVVPAGSFRMGSPSGEAGREDDEGPAHRVEISKPFAIGRFEVTRGEYARFVSETGHSSGTACWIYEGGEWEERTGRNWRSPGFAQADSHPAVCVDWKDARSYVAWLSRKTGEAYRLLSESEWEYAARAGTTSSRYWGNAPSSACRYANVYDRTGKDEHSFDWSHHDCRDGHGHTSSAGVFDPNGFGLHDMLGNVWEWVADCWNESYAGAPADGSAWTSGDCSRRVLRGGSWVSGPWFVRSASRNWSSSGNRGDDLGFRVARTLD